MSEENTMNTNDLKLKRQPKLLLVEDNPMIQTVTLILLRNLGCQVDLAENGIQALEKFKQGYDLVLLDIDLPGINGISVARAIRSEEEQGRTQKNILVALTASNDHLKNVCFAAGMDGFYTKPAHIGIIKEIFNRWLPSFGKCVAMDGK